MQAENDLQLFGGGSMYNGPYTNRFCNNEYHKVCWTCGIELPDIQSEKNCIECTYNYRINKVYCNCLRCGKKINKYSLCKDCYLWVRDQDQRLVNEYLCTGWARR